MEQRIEADETSNDWIAYSDMNKLTYTALLTSFSLSTSLVTHPLNVVTTRLQAGIGVKRDNSSSNNLMLNTASKIGWRGMFRGWLPNAISGIPSQMIYFNATESSREYLQKEINALSLSPSTVDAIQSILTSCIANSTSLIPYVPGEVVSSRLQVQGRNGIGMTAMAVLIWQENGIRGLYRGFTASLLSSMSFSACWWWSYSVCRREFSKIDYLEKNLIMMDAATGLVAGLFATISTHPVDTVKTRIMTTKSKDGSSQFLQTARELLRKEGPKALWRGLRTSCTQSALTATGFAVIYEFIKRSSFEAEKKSE